MQLLRTAAVARTEAGAGPTIRNTPATTLSSHRQANTRTQVREQTHSLSLSVFWRRWAEGSSLAQLRVGKEAYASPRQTTHIGGFGPKAPRWLSEELARKLTPARSKPHSMHTQHTDSISTAAHTAADKAHTCSAHVHAQTQSRTQSCNSKYAGARVDPSTLHKQRH